MWEMAEEFEIRLKYVGNDVHMREMAKKNNKKTGEWRKYLTNGLINWEMIQRFRKWLKYLGNGLDTWGMA